MITKAEQYQFITEKVPALLEGLTPETKPLWGIMTAQHVLEHLKLTIHGSVGKIKLPLLQAEEKVPRSYAFLMSDKPLFRNVKLPFTSNDKPPPLHYANFEEAKAKLLAEIPKFYAYYQEEPEARNMHPFFGNLNFEEWQVFHYKHFTHHLTQFGLIS